MKGFQKLAKRTIRQTLLMMLFLFISGILTYVLIFGYYFYVQFSRHTPSEILRTVSKGLYHNNDSIQLDSTGIRILDESDTWAILVDNNNGNVIWSHALPDNIPTHYTLSEIALSSKNYLKGYPTFIWTHDDGLIMIGMPKERYTPLRGYLPASLIRDMPWLTLSSYIIQLITLLLVFYFFERRTFRSMRPILKGLQDVADGKDLHVKEKGTFSEIAAYLNRTSALLKKRATVRENWLAGVSHDIRTPLASILGYSGQIETDKSLPEDVIQKATIIRNQAVRLRELISDLNLSSRLEHDDRLIQREIFGIAPFCRKIIAEFLNDYADENYPIHIEINKSVQTTQINGSPNLLKRSIYNLLLNSIRHNPTGCTITFRLERTDHQCKISITDDGIGLQNTLLEKLKKIQGKEADSTLLSGQEHGLGLYIVCQIIKMHSGNITYSTNTPSGFQTSIYLPIL